MSSLNDPQMMRSRKGPEPRYVQIALGSALDGQQHAPPHHAAPHVGVGAPVIEGQPPVGEPHIALEVGTPQIEPQHPRYAVTVGTPQMPANPAYHAPYQAQAANMIAYGRRAGWRPQELASALDHVRQSYDSGGGQ